MKVEKIESYPSLTIDEKVRFERTLPQNASQCPKTRCQSVMRQSLNR